MLQHETWACCGLWQTLFIYNLSPIAEFYWHVIEGFPIYIHLEASPQFLFFCLFVKVKSEAQKEPSHFFSLFQLSGVIFIRLKRFLKGHGNFPHSHRGLAVQMTSVKSALWWSQDQAMTRVSQVSELAVCDTLHWSDGKRASESETSDNRLWWAQRVKRCLELCLSIIFWVVKNKTGYL